MDGMQILHLFEVIYLQFSAFYKENSIFEEKIAKVRSSQSQLFFKCGKILNNYFLYICPIISNIKLFE